MRAGKQLSDRMLSWHAWVLGTAINKQTNKQKVNEFHFQTEEFGEKML